MPTRKTSPYYNSAIDQSIFTQGGQLHVLGDEMWVDNRKFRYCRAGANLTRGYACTHLDGNVESLGQTSSHIPTTAAGDYTVRVRHVTGVTANEFTGGVLMITEGAGEGYAYPVLSNTAAAAPSTGSTLTLETPIRVATATGTTAGLLMDSPYVVQNANASSTAPESPVCVPLIDVTSGNYFWGQVKGWCLMRAATRVITKGAPVILATISSGRAMSPSTAAKLVLFGALGRGLVASRATTEWGMVMLNLE